MCTEFFFQFNFDMLCGGRVAGGGYSSIERPPRKEPCEEITAKPRRTRGGRVRFVRIIAAQHTPRAPRDAAGEAQRLWRTPHARPTLRRPMQCGRAGPIGAADPTFLPAASPRDLPSQRRSVRRYLQAPAIFPAAGYDRWLANGEQSWGCHIPCCERGGPTMVPEPRGTRNS